MTLEQSVENRNQKSELPNLTSFLELYKPKMKALAQYVCERIPWYDHGDAMQDMATKACGIWARKVTTGEAQDPYKFMITSITRYAQKELVERELCQMRFPEKGFVEFDPHTVSTSHYTAINVDAMLALMEIRDVLASSPSVIASVEALLDKDDIEGAATILKKVSTDAISFELQLFEMEQLTPVLVEKKKKPTKKKPAKPIGVQLSLF